MKKEVTPLCLSDIKIAAKRLKKYLPEKKHTERLDIATYQVLGLKTFREAQISASKILKKRSVTDTNQGPFLMEMTEMGRSVTYGQMFDILPSFKRGDWYLYPQSRALVFDGEFSPYVFGLDELSDSSKLLDVILQIQKKKWSKEQIEGTNVSPTYQLDEFITLIDELCRFYLNDTIQGVFSPFGKFKTVKWPKNLELVEPMEAKQDV